MPQKLRGQGPTRKLGDKFAKSESDESSKSNRSQDKNENRKRLKNGLETFTIPPL